MSIDKITTAGIYDVSMADYHGDLCAGPSISASGLIKIEQTCPAVYWHGSYLNPDRPEEADTPAMLFGRVCHALMLEGEGAARRMVGILAADHNGRTKEGRAAVQAIRDDGKLPISYDEWCSAFAMAKALRAHPMAAKAFSDGRPERTLVWQDPATGVWLKARPDWLPNASQFVPNYKTARSAKPSEWARQAVNLGYHQSAALTMEGLKVCCGMDKPHGYFVVQESAPPYVVTILTLSDVTLDWGAVLNRRAIDTFARCLDRGEWPGYAESVVQVDMPAWAERQLGERHTAGEFTPTDWTVRYHATLEDAR